MPAPALNTIDLAAFTAAPLQRDPFDHVIVPGFVPAEALDAVARDFPAVDRPGSFPIESFPYGAGFQRLLDAMHDPAVTDAMAAKFAIDLTGRPIMVTARGRCRPTDGKIHTDSKDKLVTVLIYLNSGWQDSGGRLRLLRRPDDLEDYAVEVPPDAGTLLAFRCTPNAWHGHKPFEGERRAIQINWVSSGFYRWREHARHRLSAWTKRLSPAA
jgi:hypothetical protein